MGTGRGGRREPWGRRVEKRRKERELPLPDRSPRSQEEADRQREDDWDYPGDGIYTRGRDDENLSLDMEFVRAMIKRNKERREKGDAAL